MCVLFNCYLVKILARLHPHCLTEQRPTVSESRGVALGKDAKAGPELPPARPLWCLFRVD